MERDSYLKRQFSLHDCVYWVSMALVPLVAACAAIGRESLMWLCIYIVLFVVVQGFIMRFLCTHCPHYCRDEAKLRCLFLWNAKKIFMPRPGPWNSLDYNVIAVVMLVLGLFPLYWLIHDVTLLAVYILSGINFVSTLRRYECPRCIYFECPVNCVPDDVKKEFSASGEGGGKA